MLCMKLIIVFISEMPLICLIHFQGTFPLLEEELHIKDAVSRILVELIKRLWPQLWPDLFPHLSESCHHGVSEILEN